MQDSRELEQCAAVLRVLASPERLRILYLLRNGARSVGDIAKCLEVPAAKLSHHLSILREAGMVHGEKTGRIVRYSLPSGFFQSGDPGARIGHFDLGCCRLGVPVQSDVSQ